MKILESLTDKAMTVIERREAEFQTERERVRAEMKLGNPYTPPKGWPDHSGWAPDPEREFSAHWQPAPKNVNISYCPSNLEDVEAMNRKLRQRGMTHTRVRILKAFYLGGDHPSVERGSVVDLTPLSYLYNANLPVPRCEPVPASVPVKIIPRVAIPSSLDKARRIAASELGKEPESLSIAQIWKHFATRKPVVNFISDVGAILEK